jgi:hypothetical protein
MNFLRFLSFSCALVTASIAVAAEAASKPSVENGYAPAGFELLAAFPFNPPEPDPDAKPGTPPPSAAKQIPPAVKALDGRKVIVRGYMLPTKMEKGLVTEFLLMNSAAACCYGATPRINEFIVVKMVKGGVKSLMDVSVEFHGTLSVKEVFEEGFLSHIYALDAEKMGKAATD